MGSSESSKCTVPDIGVEEVKKKMIFENHRNCVGMYVPYRCYIGDEDKVFDVMKDSEKENILSNFYLKEITWWYQRIGSHRVLQLYFKCSRCGECKWVEMDKTTRGKNISYGFTDYQPPQWWHWEKEPRYSYNFNEILNYFYNAPNYYNLTKNNCKDFANYIWKRID